MQETISIVDTYNYVGTCSEFKSKTDAIECLDRLTLPKKTVIVIQYCFINCILTNKHGYGYSWA